MAACECERCRVVSAETKRGRHKLLQAVALIAEIEVGCRRKLARMHIRMAVVAALEFDFVDRDFALRHVTLCAQQSGVLSLQGIRRRRMLLQSEGGGLEPINRVAIRALAAADTLFELASMRILLMAVGTFLKVHPFFEVTLRMAAIASHGRMFAEQWVLCSGVIERPIQL